MILLPTLGDMALRVLGVLQVPSAELSRSSSQFYSAKVVDHINASYGELTQQAQSLRRAEIMAYENAVLDTDTHVLDIRLTPSMGQVIGICPRSNVDDLTPTKREWTLMRYGPNQGDSFLEDRQYFPTTNGDIVLPDQTRKYWRIWYLKEMAPLVQGTAAAGSATSITFPASAAYGTSYAITDLYNGSILYISSGTGAGQGARIVDFDGTTRVATCESYSRSTGDAFSVAPSTDSVFSVVPWFPGQFTELMCLMAAARFHKNDQSADIIPELARLTQTWRQWLNAPDRSTPRRIINQGRVDSGIGISGMFGGSGRLESISG